MPSRPARRLHACAADDHTIGEHVEVVVIPLAGETARGGPATGAVE
jgi:hypothetical protein